MSLTSKIFLVCKETLGDIDIPTKKQDVVFKRWIYFKVAKDINTKASLTEIGKHVNRDHTTVLHGLKMFELDIRPNPDLYKVYVLCFEKCVQKLTKTQTKNLRVMSKTSRYLHENINLKQRIYDMEKIFEKIPSSIKTKYA